MRRKSSGPTASAEIPVTHGSENIYAELCFTNPAEQLAKARLALMIDEVSRERHLTQRAAAAPMEIDQPKVSYSLHGRLGASLRNG
jgi:hypothetical protein